MWPLGMVAPSIPGFSLGPLEFMVLVGGGVCVIMVTGVALLVALLVHRGDPRQRVDRLPAENRKLREELNRLKDKQG
jgi:hypothetical protein